MHQSVVEIVHVCNNIQEAREDLMELRTALAENRTGSGFADRSIRNAPVFALERPENNRVSAIQNHRAGHANGCQGNLIFRVARARRHRRSRKWHQIMNAARYFVPARFGAVVQLPVLAGAKHRFQILSRESVRSFSAHQFTGLFRQPRGL